jgi:hypothetical protein
VEQPKSMGRHADREGWPAGPWDLEDDRYEWRHLGFPCLIFRAGHTGALCGYIAIPPKHPWYKLHGNDLDVDVHGGITYAADCHGVICHEPRKGESRKVWWLGFDCGHAFDVMPALIKVRQEARELLFRTVNLGVKLPDERYRDLAYVTAEVNRLAEQAEAAK